jgi:hypothetical protein
MTRKDAQIHQGNANENHNKMPNYTHKVTILGKKNGK